MRPRILIVDDEKAILFAMREYFSAFGFEVDCARDKQEAETLLAERCYSVLITDLRLTGSDDTDGLDIARFGHERHPSMRSILLTAYGTPEIERSAYERGISVCLSKPRPLDEILETASRLFENPISRKP
jgi:DNA-binding NtrC family response regulator